MPACVAGTELAVWRSKSGTVHAWGDRCPHRGMRLSHGFVRGDQLACIYHGWQYDTEGACTQIPAHPALTPPKSICAQTFACQISDAVVWVSLATPQTPPPSLPSSTTPIRSIPLMCPAADVAAHFGAPDQGIVETNALTLALQPTTATACMIHALGSPGTDRKAASRWLEVQRTQLEKHAA